MYQEVSRLFVYRDLPKDEILIKLASVFHDFDKQQAEDDDLISRIYEQMKRLLDISTKYGFDHNLWHCYLTFLLVTNENSFTLTCEKKGPQEGGSINHFAQSDMELFLKLFHYDFKPIEDALHIDCFSTISNYHAITKTERMYNKNVSEKVCSLAKAIAQANDGKEAFSIITSFYKDYGVGMFGLNKAFRIKEVGEDIEFLPINNMETVLLDDLIGYESQKQELIANTEAFVHGRSSNNVLLYGEPGTGKSTSIKAIVNQYYDAGLRMIEIYKHQFKDLSTIIANIKNRNYRFIIYMDDLSFEEDETEYKFLKAVIEGGVETRPDNVLIYATSNRRHLIKETWRDRNDVIEEQDMHISETMQEKLSLVARFGISIYYGKPSPKEYHTIVQELVKRYPQIDIDEQELWRLANQWELKHGGVSGRTAQQLVNYLAGKLQH